MTVDVSSMDGAQLPADDFVPFSTSPTSEPSPKKRKLNDSEADWPPPHVDALQSVLGDSVDSETLDRLWAASGGSVERALNAFFDGSFDKPKTGKHAQHAAIAAPAAASAQDVSDIRPTRRSMLPPGLIPRKQELLRTSVFDAAPPRQQVQRATASVEQGAPAAEIARQSHSPETYYVGAFMVAGYATTKGRNLLSVGDQVRFERDRLAAPKVTTKKRGRTAGLSYPASVASRHRNVIVRFTNSRCLEVGRLPAEVARFVSTLLDQAIFVFTGSVIFAPENLKTGEDIILQVRTHVKRRAFSRFSERAHQLDENDREAKDQELKDFRVAMLSLIQRCGLKPTLSGAAAAKISGSDPDSEAVLKAAIAEATARPKSAAPSNPSVGGDVRDGEVAYDEEKKVTEGDLSILYTRAQRLDAALPEMKPADEFGLTLRGYQRQALAWMYAKETEPCGQSEAGGSLARSREAMIHPLWEEYAFGSDEADSFPADTPSTWYFSPYSGEISITFPLAESQSRSGILADEMGLGKTIEILALVHANQSTAPLIPKKQCKATLVVCPMSLLAQWRDESANACPSLKCQMYYGSARDSTTRFDSADIVLTSYGTLASEYASWTGSDGQRGRTAPPLFAVEFHRVVLDEAHQIKNRLSKTAKACSAVEARRRWCVTGTPIQNKLEDLFSLVHFLRIKPWSNFLFWKAHITIPFEENKDYRALQTVQTVLEPIILMRTKNMKDARGRCIVDLPEKEILIERLDLTEQERDIYDSLFRDSKTKFNTYCAAGKVLSHFASIFQLLMRLRQVCDHPVLALGGTKDLTNGSPDGPVDINELIARFTKGDCYDSERGQVSQGAAPTAFAQSVIQRLMRGAEEDKNGMPNECAICFEQTISPVLMTTCMHTACRDCVMAYLQKRDDEGKDGECPICRKPLTAKDLVDVVQRCKGKPSDSDEGNSSNSASLAIDLRRNNFRSSTKLDALITHLVRIREQGSPGEGELTRSVVFSQFTSMLDLVEVVLAKNDIPYGRLDGTMNQGQRERVLESFKSTTKGGPEVLLVSLRAGGVGLNLTSASQVFMMDPWWNFEIEKQAIDRVHRIGQTQKVTVRRFIIRDTVEEKMLTIQERKSALAGGALGLNHEEAKERRLEELMILFK